jgi:uncharacterized repeat protein (TIGR01451 family)
MKPPPDLAVSPPIPRPHRRLQALAWCLLLALATPARPQVEMTASGAAVASGSDLLETEIVVERLEPADPPGRPSARFVPAERLEAGDEVYYTLKVRNPGAEPVTDAQVTKRMPYGLHYLPGSASGPDCDIDFSVDGGRTFVARPPGTEFTHVRWTLRRPLPPGSTALLRFRATFR